MKLRGTFDIVARGEPPYDSVEGVSLARTRFDKRFVGPLEATSTVEMLAARTPVEGSAVYVAVERVTGTLAGRTGTFVLAHTGVMNRGERSLSVLVVPDSGTGALRGLAGRMDIQIVDGQHFYDLDVELPDAV